MNFQEKYDEYKQRREAKKFFNQNNDYHLNPVDYVKLFIAGIIAGTIVSVIFNVLTVQLSLSLSIFYLLTGYAVGYAVLKVAKYGSEKTGIISVLCYFISLWFGLSVMMFCFLPYFQATNYIFECLYMAMMSLLHQNLIAYLFIFAGAFIAYSIGKD